MTTEAAARLYRARHLLEMEGKGYAVYNPNNKPLEELPIIYGFNNGGSRSWYQGLLLAEDGTCLGSHICSHEAYMPHDLGILDGTRPDRHKEFKKHYPDGYQMNFVSFDKVEQHKGLMEAFRLNQIQGEEAKQENRTGGK